MDRNGPKRTFVDTEIDRLGNWARKWGMRFQPVKSRTVYTVYCVRGQMQHDAADKQTFK